MDIYKIPQPVPVDISYTVKIICNRMRELNEFNKNIIETFASRQAYTTIKGHYIPIIMGNISDESVMDIEKRKYYIQSYEFTVLGFLIDENEFEVSPAITRVLQVVEFDTKIKKRSVKPKDVQSTTFSIFTYPIGVVTFTQVFNYTTNITLGDLLNINSFNVYINGYFYGSDLSEILINTNDSLKIDIIKKDVNKESTIKLNNVLI
jgi:hypothetical protein